MKKVWGAGSLINDRMPCSFNICKRGGTNEENGLLEIIAVHRTATDLDKILKTDKYYQDALEEEQAASDIMDNLNLTAEQKKAVDRVITAYNECGAAYGAVAYRFGMEDGIRVRMEMEEIMRMT